MSKKIKFERKNTPVGMAKLSFVHDPSQPFEGKGKPQYKQRLLLEDTAENRAWVEGVIADGQAFAKANGIKLKKVFKTPVNLPEDEDDDDFEIPEGRERARLDEDFRGKIWFEAKSVFQPGLVDSKGNSLPDTVKVYGDDTVRQKIEIVPYDGLGSGISFRLVTVQLIEKNTSFSRGPDTSGMDDYEGGYVAPGSGDDDEDF